MKMFKIRIYQPWVPHYRLGLFEGVGTRYTGRVEIFAPAESDEKFKSLKVDNVRCDYNHREHKLGPFFIMRNAHLKGLTRGDVVVIEGNIRKLSFLKVAIIARMRGIGVVWWGLHKMPNQRRIPLMVRAKIMKLLSNTILFYNKMGLDWYRQQGEDCKHVFAVGNAIDEIPIKQELEFWNEDRLRAFLNEHDLSGKRLILACSRLSDKVRLHEAIAAMADTEMPDDVILVVIGDGPNGENLKTLAKSLQVDKKILWLGGMYEQHEMAPWFLSAKLFLYPGPVGLGVLHAHAYKLPAILNDTHNSTEAEAFINGKSGLMFNEFDVHDMVRKIKVLLDNEKLRIEMGEFAQKRVFKDYSMASMINNYCNAIEDAANQVS